MKITVRLKKASVVLQRLKKVQVAVPRQLSAGVRAATIFTESLFKREILSGQVVMRRSGNLSRATFHEFPSKFRGVIGWGKEASYAAFVNDGTRPHLIAPKNAKALAFVPSGVAAAIRGSAFASMRSSEFSAAAKLAGSGVVGNFGRIGGNSRRIKAAMRENTAFAMVVHHPGTAPTRFAQIGLAMATPDIRRIVNEYIANAVKGVESGE